MDPVSYLSTILDKNLQATSSFLFKTFELEKLTKENGALEVDFALLFDEQFDTDKRVHLVQLDTLRQKAEKVETFPFLGQVFDRRRDCIVECDVFLRVATVPDFFNQLLN